MDEQPPWMQKKKEQVQRQPQVPPGSVPQGVHAQRPLGMQQQQGPMRPPPGQMQQGPQQRPTPQMQPGQMPQQRQGMPPPGAQFPSNFQPPMQQRPGQMPHQGPPMPVGPMQGKNAKKKTASERKKTLLRVLTGILITTTIGAICSAVYYYITFVR